MNCVRTKSDGPVCQRVGKRISFQRPTDTFCALNRQWRRWTRTPERIVSTAGDHSQTLRLTIRLT